MYELLSITLIILLAAISPGPDFAVVTKNALLYSRKSGIFTAVGVSTSLLIHSTYCILGLAIVIAKSLLLFSIIKYLGAGYLIYLGIKGLLSKEGSLKLNAHKQNTDLSASKSFVQGLLCNLLNPKAIVFLLAFFTLIMSPSMSRLAQIGYGLEIVFIHLIWFSWLSIMITHHSIRTHIAKVQHYIIKAMGVALIGFGVRIATLESGY